MDNKEHCLACLKEKGLQQTCPHCGYGQGSGPESLLHLPPGTELQGKYVIGRALGQGGFGITYLAWDKNLKIKLAIKEYLPQQLATRRAGQNEVSVVKSSLSGEFKYGLQKFLEEARTLARFIEHPNVVSVRDYFEANNTAYLVMNYHEGVTLQQYLQARGGKIAFEQALDIFMPVLDALKEVHAAGILHRDISPDNLLVNTRGQVVLIDFGAARQAVGEKSGSLSVIMKAGYSPLEQYMSKGRQGPWTDIYAVAATIYRSLTGRMPPESLDRLKEDPLIKPSVLSEDIKIITEKALLKALSVFDEDRYQAVEEFQEALLQGEKFSEQEGRSQDSAAELLPDRETAGADPEPGAKLFPLETGPGQLAEEVETAGKEKHAPAGREEASAAPVKEKEKKFALTGNKKLALIAAAVLVGGILLYGGMSFLVASPEDALSEESLINGETQVLDLETEEAEEVAEDINIIADQAFTEESVEALDPQVILTILKADYMIDYREGSIPLSDLEIGARVVDPTWYWEFRTEANYTGSGEKTPVVWIVVAKDHYEKLESHVTLLADDLIGRHIFDNSSNRGGVFGSSHWGKSGTENADQGLRPWLNSTGIYAGSGFYETFADNFKAAVLNTRVPNKEWRTVNEYISEDKLFIPSSTELGYTEQGEAYQIGSVLAYFEGAGSEERIAQLDGKDSYYWTRTPTIKHHSDMLYFICPSGKFNVGSVSYNKMGVRPILNLSSDVMVSETRN